MKTEAQIRKVLANLYEQTSGEPLPSGSIKHFFESWLARKHAESAGATFSRYKTVVEQFLKHLDAKVEMDINYLTPQDILSFRNALLKRVSPTSINLNIKILRAALNQARREGLIQINPAQQVETVKQRRGGVERRAFTLPELQRILEVASPEWKGLIMFGIYTGQRLGDIAILTWANLDLEREEIRFVTRKTDRQIILPLTRPLLRFIESLPVSDDPKQPLFSHASQIVNERDRSTALSNEFYEILVQAGLAKPRSKQATGKGRSGKRKTSEISFHSLRHTATSLLKNAGVSDAVAQEFIGHDSVAASRNYTHIELATLRKAANLMPDVLIKLPKKHNTLDKNKHV
ncbi:MAG: tyrosine-type recombinase/integrase [bacterium]